MTTKPRLTAEQHTEMGRALAGISDALTHRATKLANAYPQSGPESAPIRHLEKACKALSEARSALDAALCREHPDEFETTVYYPYPEDRAAFAAPADLSDAERPAPST